MTSRDFCYWLQGFFELNDSTNITQAQAETIKKHLSMVFYHEIDPSFGEDREGLDDIHNGQPTLDKLKDRLKDIVDQVEDEIQGEQPPLENTTNFPSGVRYNC